MRVVQNLVAEVFVSEVRCPDETERDEESLLRSKAVFLSQRVLLQCVLECLVCDVQTAVVSDVLSKGELSVNLYSRENFLSGEEISKDGSSLVELGLVFRCPPVAHVSVLVEQAALIVKAVAHLVADYNTNCAVVGGIVCCRIEEWRLKDTCREADFVCSRVVICVDGLRGHKPLGLVNRLSNLTVYHIRNIELGSVAHILVIGKRVVYLKF